MSTKKLIRLTEQDFKNMVRNTVKMVLREWDGEDYLDDAFYEDDDQLTGKEDFENSGFELEMKKRYPHKNLEIWCDNDGTVTVIDLDTEQDYIGYGKIKYETRSLGYPDPSNPHREAEGDVGYYDFTECFKDITAQIDADERYKKNR